jgi:hypothetical protein
MTVQEILDYMRLRYDAYASQDAPGYDDDDLVSLFNKAQKVFAKSLYNEFGNPTRKGAEESEKRSKDLVQLKAHDVITPPFAVGDHPNSYFVKLPEDFWVTLKEELDITYTNSCGETVSDSRIPVKPIREDYYNANVKNPYKRPYEELVWRFDRERDDINSQVSSTNSKRNEIILFDGATPDNYRVSYYRAPKDIIDPAVAPSFCEFDEMHHEKIADLAVELAMQTTDRPGLQSKMIENSKIIE